MKNSEVLIVGYGNTLRSDDAFGPVVAERLARTLSDPRVRILSRPLLSVDLVHDLVQVDFCVLVDAATTGDEMTVNVRKVTPESTEVATLGHELSAAALLGLTRQLNQRVPQCYLYSVVPSSTELGEELTPRVNALVEVAVASIRERVRHYLDGLDGEP